MNVCVCEFFFAQNSKICNGHNDGPVQWPQRNRAKPCPNLALKHWQWSRFVPKHHRNCGDKPMRCKKTTIFPLNQFRFKWWKDGHTAYTCKPAEVRIQNQYVQALKLSTLWLPICFFSILVDEHGKTRRKNTSCLYAPCAYRTAMQHVEKLNASLCYVLYLLPTQCCKFLSDVCFQNHYVWRFCAESWNMYAGRPTKFLHTQCVLDTLGVLPHVFRQFHRWVRKQIIIEQRYTMSHVA